MRRGLVLCALLAASCAPPAAKGLPKDALDAAIGGAVGDPSTCVVIAERSSLRVVYRYGDAFSCGRTLPACDQAGRIDALEALKFAAAGRMTSCPTAPDGSRTVGWSADRVPSKTRDLVYSAVMEGERALPGREMHARLYDAFVASGV